MEVSCGNTLFRVHTSILYFRSPSLRLMFTQTNLASAESPKPQHPTPRCGHGFPYTSQGSASPRVSPSIHSSSGYPADCISTHRFPERNDVLNFPTFSSLLRAAEKYEVTTASVRFQDLEVVRNAYPETLEGPTASKPLGESTFSGRTPHPIEVPNFFIQQKLTSAHYQWQTIWRPDGV